MRKLSNKPEVQVVEENEDYDFFPDRPITF